MNDKTQMSAQNDDDEIDLLELVHTMLDGKWLILFFILLSTSLAFIYAFGKTPIYKADTVLQVESKKAAIPGLDDLAGLGLGGEANASVGTEIEIIKSRKNLKRAIEKLNLDIVAKPRRIPLLGNLYSKFFNTDNVQKLPKIWGWLDKKAYPYAWGNEKITINHLEVPAHLLDKNLTLISREKNSFDLLFDKELILQGKVARRSSSKDGSISINVQELVALPGTKFTLQKKSNLEVIQSLQKAIKVSEKGKRTGIISLALEGADKQLIVKILDHISEAYLVQNESRSSLDAAKALKFLKDQIQPFKDKVDKAEESIKLYRTQHHTVDVSMEAQAVLNVVAGIDVELQKLSLKQDELRQKYASNHPVIQVIKAQEKKLKKRKKRTLSKISKLPETQQELLKRERNYKVASGIYLNLLKQIQSYKVIKASTVGNVDIVDKAVVYNQPVKPKKGLILVLGVLLGGMLGVLLVFLKKALRQTVDDPEKLAEITGIPVYAKVPLSTSVKLTGGFNKDKKQKSLLAITDSSDPAIEHLRSLRTSLHFALMEAKNNIVMITGPSPGIGKSFISSNFASVLASTEQKVLLIDADMRKGYLHSVLDKKIAPGLSDLITDQATLEEVIHTIQIGDNSMDIITRGKTPPNPSELLMHSRFKKLLDQFSEQYDLILIDTPPVHAVGDSAIIGALSGVVFMVVYFDLHSMKEIEDAVRDLAHRGVETKGFIFNGYNPKKSSYGYGYHSYYGDYKSDNN